MDGKKENTLTRWQIKEQELLDEYETDRLAHTWREISTDFYVMMELMRGSAEGKDGEDFTSFSVGVKIPAVFGQIEQSVFRYRLLAMSHEKNHGGNSPPISILSATWICPGHFG